LIATSAYVGAAACNNANSHIPITPQFFKCIFAFLVLRATGTLRRLRVAKFLDDFADVARSRFDGKRAGRAADAPIALALIIREIEGDDRDPFALDVFPDIQLRPV